MNCRKNTYDKMLLICIFVELGESNAKMFDEIRSQNKLIELGFAERDFEQNKQYLRNWFKDNNVKMKDFDIPFTRGVASCDENGVPIIVRRVKHRVKKEIC